MPEPRVAFVVRLSREDINQPGTMEEKFALRLSMCRELSARYGLPEPAPENILVEQISGKRLSKRTGFRALLDRCETGQITHIVSPDQSRLLRGDKRDEADVEDALLAGCITLITTEGVIQFDEEYESRHALTFEVRALAARHYLRDVIKKMKEANRQRAIGGQRSQGIAPYGYRWVKAVYESRQKVSPGHYEIVGDLELVDEQAALEYAIAHAPECLHEPNGKILNLAVYLALARRQGQPGGALLPGVECVSGEYAILCEIFRRIRSEGYVAIQRDLNLRAIPPGSQGRFRSGNVGNIWYESTLRNIVTNPHHAGFPAHRVTMNRRGEKVKLPPDKWVLSADEQAYPHPIRLPEWESLKERITARANPGSARPRSPSLLTGLLYCSEGRPARVNSVCYACRCGVEGHYHPGGNLRRGVADELALVVLTEAIASLPDTRPQKKGRRAKPGPPDALFALRQEIARKQKELTTLRAMEATFLRAGTAQGFTETLSTLEQEIACLETKQRAESQVALYQAQEEALRQIAQVKRAGLTNFWEQADIALRRTILRLVIERLEIVAPDAKFDQVRRVRVVVQPWIAPYYDPKALLTKRFRG